MNPKDVSIRIEKPNIQLMNITIHGTAPLIFNKWSEKAKQQMRDIHQKKANKGREIRNPEEEYKNSYYRNSEGKIAFPALNLKLAIVAASRAVDGVPMTLLKQNIFVLGDKDGLIPIEYLSEEMREDMVRVGKGATDFRYRGQVNDWSMKLTVKWNAGKFSKEQVVNLIALAGFSSGIGEWRPERSGDFGTFEIN